MTNRRDFLKLGCGAVGLAAFEQGLERFGLMTHAAQASPGNYKALVCIFMFGGNDSNNMVVPLFPNTAQLPGYAAYTTARGPDLAIPQGSFAATQVTPSSLGLLFGLHPSMAGLAGKFTAGKLAVVCNTGPLNLPFAINGTAKTQYQTNAAYRPYQLFSHSDQQSLWMSPRADQKTNVGWGGMMADKVAGTFNTGASFPASASVAGNNQFSKGVISKALSIAPAPTGLNQVFVLNGFAVTAADTARKTAMNNLRGLDTAIPLVNATSVVTQQAVDISSALTVDPTVGAFPNTSLGNQLKQVAKLIKLNYLTLNPPLGRQVFFCSIGGFDTHQGQLTGQTNLFGQLSAAMTAFDNEMIAQGLSNDVTVFTQSDFGRTLAPSGTGTNVGSDHAWGSHHFVLGGAVHGGDFYGVPGQNGTVFPSLTLGGINDTDSRGRWMPTCAADQYASTLGLWFGVIQADLNTIFPNLGHFATTNLGFLG